MYAQPNLYEGRAKNHNLLVNQAAFIQEIAIWSTSTSSPNSPKKKRGSFSVQFLFDDGEQWRFSDAF